MPKIILKHKSPEYADEKEESGYASCDMPGCADDGTFKAPKHRSLNEYYFFCFDHIKEYNKAWNFFSGMSQSEVKNHMHSSFYGDRPTWKADFDPFMEDNLREAAHKKHSYTENNENAGANSQYHSSYHTMDKNTPEYEAMAIMGLAPPVTLDEIKTQYKTLAKKYHPDLNKNPDAEELLKTVNMAYTILKLAYEEYSHLEKK